jgi:phage terminase small subunit
MRSLNPKHRKFIAEYLKDQNATQAAIRAGYSKNTARSIGCELLTNPNIHKAIESALTRNMDKAEVTAESIIVRLNELANRCMQAQPVLGPFGIQRTNWKGEGVWEFDSSGAARALELLGKTRGMFVDKHDVTVGGRMVVVPPKEDGE